MDTEKLNDQNGTKKIQKSLTELEKWPFHQVPHNLDMFMSWT